MSLENEKERIENSNCAEENIKKSLKDADFKKKSCNFAGQIAIKMHQRNKERINNK